MQKFSALSHGGDGVFEVQGVSSQTQFSQVARPSQKARKSLSLTKQNGLLRDARLASARVEMVQAKAQSPTPKQSVPLQEESDSDVDEDVEQAPSFLCDTPADSSSCSDSYESDFEPKQKKIKPGPTSILKPKGQMQKQVEESLLLNDLCRTQADIAAEIMDTLPSGFKYKITELTLYKDPNHFTAVIRANITNKEDALKWVEEFEILTSTNFRREDGQENTPKIVYKKNFRCHHNTRASLPSSKTKKPHAKHVNCPAVLIVTVNQSNMPLSKDEYLKQYPTRIYLKSTHNHKIKCAAALKHRRPTAEVKEEFMDMFRHGHSPASALESKKFDLKVKYGAEYYVKASDGGVCPSLRSLYYIYYSMFKKCYGEPDGLAMVESLKKFINEYNEKCGSKCAVVEQTGDDLIVVIATPFMKRVLVHLKGSGEMMFMDSGGGMDRHNSRIFLLLAPSVAGALPTGVLILSSEKETVLTRALELHKSIIPEASFYGRGRDNGPQIGMTDDCTSERNSLNAVYASIILLLCVFHVLQAFWRYIWNADHKVAKEDRAHIYDLFHAVVYAKDFDSFNEMYDNMLKDSCVAKYSLVLQHLQDLRERAAEWALCLRQDLLTRGHVTNNYAEAIMRVLKDIILKRTKAFSVVQLFDFLSVRLDTYFEMRITAVITNRMASYTSSRYHIPESKLVPLSCKKISDNLYVVSNSETKKEYMVNIDIELCECPVGFQGAPCKHQYAVVKAFNLSSNQFLPFLDVPTKMYLHFIMTGSQPPRDFYENLTGDSTAEPRNDQIYDFSDLSSSQIQSEVDTVLSEQEDESRETPDCDTELDLHLANFFTDLKERIKKNPDVGACAKTFLRRYAECKSDAGLQHALSTFNRYKGQAPTNEQTLTCRNVKRSSRIPVRTTSRRTGPHMGGRNAQITGRPAKSARCETNYAKQPPQPNWMKPPSKPFRAPQNIAQCVVLNIPLGKRK